MLGNKPVTIPVVERPAVSFKQFVIQRRAIPAQFVPLTPVTGVEQEQVCDFQLPAAAAVEAPNAQAAAVGAPNVQAAAAGTPALAAAMPTTFMQLNSVPTRRLQRSYAEVTGSAPAVAPVATVKVPLKKRKLQFDKQLVKDNESTLLQPKTLNLRSCQVLK